MDKIFKGFGVEVSLKEQEDFLKVKETLTRMGIASKKDNILYQSCHIFHKQGQYAIMHFKEMFAIDGKPYNLTDDDIARRNKIVSLLQEWDLLKIVEPDLIKDHIASISQVKIINHKEKSDWTLENKYNIGKKR